MGLGRALTEAMGHMGNATNTKSKPDTTKYVSSKPTVAGDKGSTVDTIRSTNRKTKEAADSAGE